MADVVGTLNKLILNPGQVRAVALPALPQVYLPCLPGSAANFDANVVAEPCFNGLSEPVNWLQGITEPAIQVRCRLYLGVDGWFTVNYLNRFLGLIAANDRPVATGVLASIGKCQWVHGDEATEFPGALVDRLQVSWRVGRPVEAIFLLKPFGDPTAATGLDATATVPYGRACLGAAVSYTGWGGVQAGAITFMNGLDPDETGPITAYAGAVTRFAGHFFVQGYGNGPLLSTVDVVNKLNSTSQIPAPTATGASVFSFTDGTNTRTVTLQGLSPNEGESPEFGLAHKRRSFGVVKTAGAASVAFG